MIVCLDVHYGKQCVTTAGVGFAQWSDASPGFEWVERTEAAAEPYESGQFYKREMPYLVHAVQQLELRHSLEVILVDAHVWLEEGRPGLGWRLFEALGQRYPVIGVAKKAFRDGVGLPVLRGESRQPLFVSATAVDAKAAAEHIRAMHGAFRLPTLLKRADRLARS